MSGAVPSLGCIHIACCRELVDHFENRGVKLISYTGVNAGLFVNKILEITTGFRLFPPLWVW